MKPDTFFSSDFWIAGSINWHGMAQQANTGIGFAKEEAVKLVAHVTDLMTKIENEIEPQLPPRPLNKGELDFYRVPQKPFNKDGSYSANFTKWLEKVGGKLYTQRDVKIGEEVFPIVGGSETVKTGVMKLGNQDSIKDWLLEKGWIPSLWNVKKDARGRPARDEKGKVIQTSPKMQEAGRLCPNLEEMDGELVKPVVKWLSLRNRKSVIEGWLENPRLDYDGRLSAGSSGLAASQRQKHHTIANLPKADPSVTLGEEVRDLFVAHREGYVLVGCDAAGLEARVEGHYTYPFPGGPEYAAELIDGDIHMKTTGDVFYEEVGHLMGTDRWNKDDSAIKPWRGKAKNVKYGISYGAQAAKLATMLGTDIGRAEEVLERFWTSAKPLALLKDRVTAMWEQSGKKYLEGIDGRKLFSRSKHSLVNLLFQSCGAIIMDYSLIFMDKWLGGLVLDNHGVPCYSYKGQYVYRVVYYHDESIWEVPQDLADEIGVMLERSIEMAGKHLKLRVPLLGESKQGKSWREIH